MRMILVDIRFCHLGKLCKNCLHDSGQKITEGDLTVEDMRKLALCEEGNIGTVEELRVMKHATVGLGHGGRETNVVMIVLLLLLYYYLNNL